MKTWEVQDLQIDEFSKKNCNTAGKLCDDCQKMVFYWINTERCKEFSCDGKTLL